MQKIIFIISIVFTAMLLNSCGVPKNFQHAIYFQDSVTESEKNIINTPVLIAPGDRLGISINAVNKTAAEDFNTGSASVGGLQQGYLVDSAGNIELLQLGTIKVGGLTTAMVTANIQQKLNDYIKGSVVTVNIINFKISMLGEVGKPGTLNVPEGKINIIQAISESGDLTLYAKRDNILVIRENNGKREFGRLDINSNHIFESPYYNLQQNDVVYIESDKTKFISNDAVTNRNLRNLSIGITILSAALLILNAVK